MPVPRNTTACAQLGGFPRVALMFLTKGELYHEQLWTLWFADAAGLLPAQHLQVPLLSPSCLRECRYFGN